MKKIVILLLLLLPLEAAAGLPWVKWKVSPDVWYYFDNREFGASGDAVLPSETLHAIVFAPTLEMRLDQGGFSSHSLVLGSDMVHNMGSGNGTDLKTPREYLIYYDYRTLAGSDKIELVAGVFPRKKMRSQWSEAFFSDRHLFEDRNLEGLLVSWTAGRFRTEFACDWAGEKGYDRKERFQLLSAGDLTLTRHLFAGWNVAYHHYAGSQLAPGVVDNGLGEVWLEANASSRGTDYLLRAGYLQGYHRDRPASRKALVPGGVEVTALARRSGVEIRNTVYFGGNQLPFYDGFDTAGNPLGSNLYFGSPMYKGFCDRLELGWEPDLGSNLSLRIAARAHFDASGFVGWQQVVSLRYCFDAVRIGRSISFNLN